MADTLTIDAQILTDVARERVLHDEWGRALRFLTTSLRGFTWDDAIAVCSGAKRLEGIGTSCELLLEDPTVASEHRSAVARRYGDRVHHAGHWYRPYAYVAGYDAEDMLHATTTTQHHPEVGKIIWGNARARYYCRDRQTDLMALLDLDTKDMDTCVWTLFERCGEPPPWFAPGTEPIETTRGRKLERFEPQSFAEAHARHLQAAKDIIEPIDTTMSSAVEGFRRGYIPQNAPSPSEVVEAVAAHAAQLNNAKLARLAEREELAERQQAQDEVEYTFWDHRHKIPSLTNGWISPEGELYRCGYYEHDPLFYNYIRHVLGEPELTKQDFERLGWVKLQLGVGMPPENYSVTCWDRKGESSCGGVLTREQVRVLCEIGVPKGAWEMFDQEGVR